MGYQMFPPIDIQGVLFYLFCFTSGAWFFLIIIAYSPRFKFMIKKHINFLVCFFVFCISGNAQKNEYQFMHIDVRQGLSHNQVNTIFKDVTGFMWFGTMSGLNRFDGYECKIFRNDLKDTTSISDNYISNIFELPDKKLWIVTRNGNNIYDARKESFSHNDQQYLAGLTLPAGNVTFISKDKAGNFWFVYQNLLGVYKFHPDTKKVEKYISNINDPGSIATNDVSMLTHDQNNNTWLIHRNGIVEKIDQVSGKVTFRTEALKNKNGNKNENYSLFIDRDNDLWISVSLSVTHGGIYYYNAKTRTLEYYSKNKGTIPLNSNIISGVVQSNDGKIWIGTDHGGVNIIDKEKKQIVYLQSDAEDHTSISQNSIWSVYKDDKGVMWLGTFKQGVNYYSSELALFSLYRHKISDARSLPFEDINRFVEDKEGNLWIGTNGGGLLHYNRRTGHYKTYRHDPEDPQSISSDVIVSLCIDHENKLWIGTYFGGLNCYDGKKFVRYRYDPDDSTSISGNSIWEIFEDSNRQLWIGTLSNGLNLFDRKTKTFHHFDVENRSLHSNYVSVIIEDEQKDLWLATSNGIDVMGRKSGENRYYGHDDKDSFSLSNNNVMSLLHDSRGRIWVGTREGLNVLDQERKKFTTFRVEDGLPDNTILTILEDHEHTLWLGTPNGLSNGIVMMDEGGEISMKFINYDEANGLQGREFNDKAALKLKTGELAFGGPYGFNTFFPSGFSAINLSPKIIFTALQVFNHVIKPTEEINGFEVLPVSITETQEITLKYNLNVFSVSFAAPGVGMSSKNKFRYKLKGFNNDWLLTDGKQRTITFTNIDPGKYVLEVMSDNDDPAAASHAATLQITILPPFWRTTPAFLIYLIILGGILYIARRFIIQRARLRFQMEQQKVEAERIHELDMMKLKFFTNVSHELRTPISLILSPVEKLMKDSGEGVQKNTFQLIHRNARRLLGLVNQLLDFRKLEMRELRLYPTMGNIIQFLKEVTLSFTDLAERKNIGFTFYSAVGTIDMPFDADKLERIMFNLLSNAFKFTREDGKISVTVNIREEESHKRMLEIKVKDSGIGISSESIEKIFERFFQHEAPANMLKQGNGIGLAISKEFARLHGGDITVDSVVNEGTTFTVLLPLSGTEAIAQQKANEEEMVLAGGHREAAERYDETKKSILIIEDNDDIRFYMMDNLRTNFTVYQAVNGKEGWERALRFQPDVIITDIMMPEMDGLQLCRKLKTDPHTSHIPVIILTARITDDQKIEGLNTGAVDYITKPFSFELLLSRIKSLMSQQESMRKLFQKQIEINPKEISATPVDEQFIARALEIVEQHIAESEFSVESLSRALFMSRVALYKKLLSLTGKTPLDFIRSIRMKRSVQLMKKTRMTVSEIAYEVGFSNPKYFTKMFKKEFGCIPSEYITENRNPDLYQDR